MEKTENYFLETIAALGLKVGLNIFYYFNFTIVIQANTYSTRLGIGTEAKCLLSSSPWHESFEHNMAEAEYSKRYITF